MAEGRDRQMWAHTSSVLALLWNVNRDPKKSRARSPAEFNPYVPRSARSGRGIPVTAGNIRLLKDIFIRPKSQAGRT